MDIARLSIIMNQSKVQETVNIALMKMVMNTERGNAEQITKMLKTTAADPDRGRYVDIRV